MLAREAGPRCKVCGSQTRHFAQIDLARSCEDRRVGPLFPPSGVTITYWLCGGCGFIFTDHFDGWTNDLLRLNLYNDDYVRVDPDFLEHRPRYFAAELARKLQPLRNGFVALDFGGGRGTFAALMRDQGFTFDSFDPFFSASSPDRRAYDLVTAFEVVEHSRQPHETFAEAVRWLAPDGALFFTTQLAPRVPDPSWWYIAPRNGHVSLHTDRSLAVCARRLGCRLVSLSAGAHLFWRGKPSTITRFLAKGSAWQALYAASRRGLWPLFGTAALVALGEGRRVLSPGTAKHLARALAVEFCLVAGYAG